MCKQLNIPTCRVGNHPKKKPADDLLTSVHPEMEGHQLVPIVNWVEIKACEKFYRRHRVDIPRIKFFT